MVAVENDLDRCRGYVDSPGRLSDRGDERPGRGADGVYGIDGNIFENGDVEIISLHPGPLPWGRRG